MAFNITRTGDAARTKDADKDAEMVARVAENLGLSQQEAAALLAKLDMDDQPGCKMIDEDGHVVPVPRPATFIRQ